jgi:hypothetical protein
MIKLSHITLAALLATAATSASAALSVTNGDFETGGGNHINNVTGWFDKTTGAGFWEGAWQTNTGGVTPNGSNVIVFSSFEADNFGMPTANANDGSYLYQSIGTADGATSLQVNFDFGSPNDDNAGGRQLGVTVGIYAWDGVGAFTAADDVDVRGGAGITLLDSESFTLTSSGVDGQISSVSSTLTLSGAGSQVLFLRFNGYTAGGTESWPVMDNVAITAVPEPGSFAALAGGIAVAAVALRRRRRA